MRAISSMATRHVLVDLAAAAIGYGLPSMRVESVGGLDAAERVAAGEQFDLVFLADAVLKRLACTGRVDVATVTPLLISHVAIAVASGSRALSTAPARAAFPTASGVRDALRGAGRIGYSSGPSGALLTKMIEEWGLTEELDGRLLLAKPGVPVARSLAEGEVDLGFQQLSELVGQPGVRVLGVMPEDCAMDTVFGGAVAAASEQPDEAGRVLAFLSSDDVTRIKSAHSFGAA